MLLLYFYSQRLILCLFLTDFDDLEDTLDGNGNCSKSNTSKTSVRSCFTAN